MAGPTQLQQQIQAMVQQAGKTYGVDPQFLYRLMGFESANFNPDYVFGRKFGGSGEVGISQIMPSTLAGWTDENGNKLPYTVDDLKDPTKAIAITAQQIAKLEKKYGNDNWKVAAAWNAGEKAVDDAVTAANPVTRDKFTREVTGIDNSKDWRNYLPQSTRDTYLPNVVGTVTPDTFASVAPKITDPNGTSGSGIQSNNISDQPPQLSDFLNDPTYTNPSQARDAYYKAYDDWQLAQAGGSKTSLYDTYLKNIISEMSNQIASGTLDTNAASKKFADLLNVAKFGQESYNNDAFKYGAPIGATSIHGPLSDIPITGGVELNPMQQALQLNSQIPDYMSMAAAARPDFNSINTMINRGVSQLPGFAPQTPGDADTAMQTALNAIRTGLAPFMPAPSSLPPSGNPYQPSPGAPPWVAADSASSIVPPAMVNPSYGR